MRIKLAIGLVVAVIATMLSVGPASAVVRVIEKANGDVLINGDAADNHVAVVFCGDGHAVVLYGDPRPGLDYDEFENYQVVEIVDDLTINLKGGNDVLFVGHPYRNRNGAQDGHLPEGCEEEEPCEECIEGANEGDYDVPGNLKILGASGNDDVDINHVSVGKDLTVSLSSGSNDLHIDYVHIGDDLTVRASGGNDDFNIYNFWIHDRMDVNLSAGNNWFYFNNGATARAIIRGHNGDDRLQTGGNDPVDFGHNPIVISAGGTDSLSFFNMSWTGKWRVNSGSGSDGMQLHFRSDIDLEAAARSGVLDLDTAAGDDNVLIYSDLRSGDDLNGGPGDSDSLRFRNHGEEHGARITNFEFVGSSQP